MQQADVAIIGGGIVGLATAYNLTQRFPERRVVVLEKEGQLAQHQTGHNSGVLHSGIYYKPGSLKAINCRAGKQAMETFCAAEGIEYEICGKVIVATSAAELPALQRIYERGQENGVHCAMIERERQEAAFCQRCRVGARRLLLHAGQWPGEHGAGARRSGCGSADRKRVPPAARVGSAHATAGGGGGSPGPCRAGPWRVCLLSDLRGGDCARSVRVVFHRQYN